MPSPEALGSGLRAVAILQRIGHGERLQCRGGHSRENQGRAQELPGTEPFAEDEEAGGRGEDRLECEDESGVRRCEYLLRLELGTKRPEPAEREERDHRDERGG